MAVVVFWVAGTLEQRQKDWKVRGFIHSSIHSLIQQMFIVCRQGPQGNGSNTSHRALWSGRGGRPAPMITSGGRAPEVCGRGSGIEA